MGCSLLPVFVLFGKNLLSFNSFILIMERDKRLLDGEIEIVVLMQMPEKSDKSGQNKWYCLIDISVRDFLKTRYLSANFEICPASALGQRVCRETFFVNNFVIFQCIYFKFSQKLDFLVSVYAYKFSNQFHVRKCAKPRDCTCTTFWKVLRVKRS